MLICSRQNYRKNIKFSFSRCFNDATRKLHNKFTKNDITPCRLMLYATTNIKPRWAHDIMVSSLPINSTKSRFVFQRWAICVYLIRSGCAM